MARSSCFAAALCLGILSAVASASWAPRPFSNFSRPPSAAATRPGARRFGHEEHRVLPDGRGVHLHWEVDAEPESFLALDWEHQNGIRLLECQQGRLLVAVPRAHAHRVAQWRVVTSSSNHHGCWHLAGRDLYHRVLRVDAHGPVGGAEAVTLATEELSSPSQLFPRCNFAVALAPPRAGLTLGSAGVRRARRLRASAAAGEAMASVVKELEGLTPKDNYNWHWNYSFDVPPLHQDLHVLPGDDAVGRLKLDMPTFDAEVGIVLNFTSEKADDGTVQNVHFVGQLDLNLDVDADFAAAVAVKGTAAAEAQKMPPMDMSGLLHLPVTLGMLRFYMGPIPMTIMPSLDSLELAVRQRGTFNGSMQASLKTGLVTSTVAEYSEDTGLRVNLSSKFTNASFLPPTVVVSTEDFELGLALVANASIRPFFNTSLRPEINMSITTLPPQPSATLPFATLPPLPPPPGMVAPALPGMPDQSCAAQDLAVSVHASVKAAVSGTPASSLFSGGVEGPVRELVPPEVCVSGACRGLPPGCKRPAATPLRIGHICVKISRAWSPDRLDPDLREQLAFGLSVLPSAVEVSTGILGNSTEDKLLLEGAEHILDVSGGHLVDNLEQGLEAAERKGIHEADTGLHIGAERAEELLNATERRLAAAAAGLEGHSAFLVRVKEAPYEITDEFLRSLARKGAFVLRDGRERELGAIRVDGIRLLSSRAAPAPGEQQLWGETAAPAAARASEGGTGARAAAAGALAAAALLGLGAPLALRRRRGYGAVQAAGGVE